MLEKIKQTAEFIKSKTKVSPEIGIILGSGLGNLVNGIKIATKMKYEDIPNFPLSTVEGHSGQLIFGEIAGKQVVAMQGRFHYYEGYSMEQVTFPVRVMKFLGIHTLMVSNAAGGLNKNFNVGDLMIITDHINHFPENPLRGKNYDELGPRFPDMSKVYNKQLIEKALGIGKNHQLPLKKGIYIGSTGPTLETPAEYRLFGIFGADATGMSTVLETTVAHHMGIRCFGVSVITNADKPKTEDGETTHDEVQDVAGQVAPKLTLLFSELIRSM